MNFLLKKFGALLKKTFGEPDSVIADPVPDEGGFTIKTDRSKEAAYLVIREDISGGQNIRGFSVSADGKEIYRSDCVGHKRIVPLNGLKPESITFRVEKSAGDYRVRDIALFDERN